MFIAVVLRCFRWNLLIVIHDWCSLYLFIPLTYWKRWENFRNVKKCEKRGKNKKNVKSVYINEANPVQEGSPFSATQPQPAAVYAVLPECWALRALRTPNEHGQSTDLRETVQVLTHNEISATCRAFAAVIDRYLLKLQFA